MLTIRVVNWKAFFDLEFRQFGVDVILYGNLHKRDILKGLGHAILGNFSTDRMVIELTKISK